MAETQLQPTLWRTCRVLANHIRLRVLKILLTRPHQTVSEVAEELGRPRSVTSEYLRALEARGLISVRRRGRYVVYSFAHPASNELGARLARALRLELKAGRATEECFKLATAFTHPRRIEIFRLLSRSEQDIDQIRVALRISKPALRRHLDKLAERGFVSPHDDHFAASKPKGPLARALAESAAK